MTAPPAAGVSDSHRIRESLTRPEAFAELFDEYAAMLYRYISKRVGPEAAEDLVGETFLIAFARRAQFDHGYGDARPWLFGIATKLLSRHHRTEAARYRAIQRAPHEVAVPSPADLVADQVSAEAVRPALARALSKLPRRDRDVLLLIAWGDLSYEEVARSLGIPIGTVRSRMHRARRTLRSMLEPDVRKEAQPWTI
ncbi:RNA polymerase sigma factor [Sinosporangium siamense]|nr:RNA polymerase sigma factor [Sinosporangium siamense]